MDGPTALKLLAILLTPSAVAGAAVWLPRAVRRLQARRDVVPAGPPLERTAADLRRLVREHEAVRRSPDLAVRAARLRALEGALTDCALDAARAVGLEPPPREGRAPLSRGQLRALLEELERSGLVLPSPERFGR